MLIIANMCPVAQSCSAAACTHLAWATSYMCEHVTRRQIPDVLRMCE